MGNVKDFARLMQKGDGAKLKLCRLSVREGFPKGVRRAIDLSAIYCLPLLFLAPARASQLCW